MSVLARQRPEDASPEPEYLVERAAPGSGPGMAPIPAVLALLSLGAASIHFAFAPGHIVEGWAHGAFFLAVAWFQLAWAVAVVLRPTRRMFLLGLLNAGVIVV